MLFTEHVLQQLSAQFQTIFFIVDPAQKFIPFLSSASHEFFGSLTEELKNDIDVFDSLIHPDDKAYLRNQWGRFEVQTTIDAEFRIRPPDMPVRWLHLRAFKLSEGENYQNCIAGFAEDITIRKEYEQNIYKIHAQKDTALQILSHDLRSPLHTISAALSLLLHEVSKDNLEKIAPYFKIIDTTCRNALELIDELLNSVFWDAQKKRMHQQLNLVNKVKTQLDAYRLLHKDQKSFELQSPSETIMIKTDPIRLQLILENMLTNAYKFTKERGKIIVKLEKKDNSVLIEVADDGVGIPEKLKPMIFQKFSKARRWGMQGEKPVGLGLHIVKTLVEQLQGRIWFSSKEDEGTSFYVELPLYIS